MTDDNAHVWDLMEKIDFCMLTSHSEDEFYSRPMSSIVRREGGRIYFLSNADAEQIDTISDHPDVLLIYGDGAKTFLSVRGRAGISYDRALIRELWNVGAQAFWPDGPDAAKVAVIAVTPDDAETWESSNGLVSTAKMAFALVTGGTPDVGGNKVVDLVSDNRTKRAT